MLSFSSPYVVIPVPWGIERRVQTSLGSPREGKDFPVQRMMAGKRGNPSVYGSAKSVPGKRQKAVPTSPPCLCLLQTHVNSWIRSQAAWVVQILNIKDQMLLSQCQRQNSQQKIWPSVSGSPGKSIKRGKKKEKENKWMRKILPSATAAGSSKVAQVELPCF